MNRQGFTALLITMNLGGGRVGMPESPPFHQEEQVAAVTEPNDIREACMTANTPPLQINALTALWKLLFPSHTLNRSNALELVKIAGSALQVYDDLIFLQGRDDIAFPFGYSKGVLASKKGQRARGEVVDEPQTVNADTWNKVKVAALRHVESNNDYTDFRQHRKVFEERGTGGSATS